MERLAGIELGGTKAVVVLGRGTTVEEQFRVDVSDANSTLPLIAAKLREWNRSRPIEGLGVASFGPVGVRPDEPDYGRILPTTPKAGWAGARLVELLAAAVDGPVAIHTDVTAAALAEGRWGAARSCADFAYMTVGTGIGIGLIVNGIPVTGRLHPEGGHMAVRRHPGDLFGGSCPVHSDCLEGLASGSAIASRAGRPGQDVGDDDPVWEFVIDAIAAGCADLFLILSSQRVILGGGVVNSRPWLVDAIAERCARKLKGYLPFVRERAPIFGAELGQDAGPRGSLILAEQALASGT